MWTGVQIGFAWVGFPPWAARKRWVIWLPIAN